MKNGVKTEVALLRGILFVKGFTYAFKIFTMIAAGYLFMEGGWSSILGIAVLPIGFLLAQLFWCHAVTRWRIWAFENVRNVHDLGQKAIELNLIFDENDWRNKLVFSPESYEQKWRVLERKFSKKDVFKEDRATPKVSVIYFSKGKNGFKLFHMLLYVALGMYLLYDHNDLWNIFLGVALTLGGGYYGCIRLNKVLDTSPQIVIDSKGIKTVATKFKSWNEIKNIKVSTTYGFDNRTAYHYLIYDYEGGGEELSIDGYNIEPHELEDLVRTHRIRSDKNLR